MDGPVISIVIPTLNEHLLLSGVLTDLRGLRVSYEVIIVDGGSGDGTGNVAMRAGATVLASSRGRGIQLRTGAAAARASWLCFLHADVRLDGRALRDLARVAESSEAAAYAFRLRIGGHGWAYRMIETAANLRSRIFGLPYGDQALIVRRQDYDAVGGYAAQPLMEDVAIVRSLKRIVPVRLLSSVVTVSPRRWEAEGPVRRSARNLMLLARYLAGQSPESLAGAYPNRPKDT